MKVNGFLGGVVVSMALAGAASASSITDDFSSFWVLGDSLSAFVSEPEGDTTARASDGPTWSEQIITDFEDAGKTAESFAEGGATAGFDRDTPLDLTGQVDALADEVGSFGDTPLVSIWIGGNDVAAFADRSLSPDATIAAYTAALNDLVDLGVTDILLFEVPDIGFTPLAQDFGVIDPAAASQASDDLNTIFFDVVAASLSDDVNVTVIETFELTETLYTDPEFFGATDSGPCILPEVGQVADCATTTFWDSFHPTGLVHSFVADEVRDAYASPIPLPAAGWMLLAGLGGLAALRRRQTAA